MLFYSVPGSRSSTTGFEAGTAVKRSVGAARRLSSRVTSESVLRAAQACSSNSTQRLFASGKHTCKTAAPAGKRCLRVRANPAEAVDCNQGMGPGRSAWLPSRAQACPDLKKKKKRVQHDTLSSPASKARWRVRDRRYRDTAGS